MSKFREPWDRDNELEDGDNTLFVYNNIGTIVAKIFSYQDLDEMNKLFENAERIVACVNACKGLTTEVLNKGVLEDAIALVLNAGKDIGVTWDGTMPYYEGVKVWEE